ncbi:MAG TPA: prepilin-type N-terminal cleavage/methylation domain-containing protein [Gammaproteobacteria bacterium]|nr:prepilin-type N-terminal cleavage/methylation domain-containing protein [Gammaproteobacteria bacterium]
MSLFSFIPAMPSRGRRANTCQRGFTLVEIAIVLVVLALMIGGFLKGQ